MTADRLREIRECHERYRRFALDDGCDGVDEAVHDLLAEVDRLTAQRDRLLEAARLADAHIPWGDASLENVHRIVRATIAAAEAEASIERGLPQRDEADAKGPKVEIVQLGIVEQERAKARADERERIRAALEREAVENKYGVRIVGMLYVNRICGPQPAKEETPATDYHALAYRLAITLKYERYRVSDDAVRLLAEPDVRALLKEEETHE